MSEPRDLRAPLLQSDLRGAKAMAMTEGLEMEAYAGRNEDAITGGDELTQARTQATLDARVGALELQGDAAMWMIGLMRSAVGDLAGAVRSLNEALHALAIKDKEVA